MRAMAVSSGQTSHVCKHGRTEQVSPRLHVELPLLLEMMSGSTSWTLRWTLRCLLLQKICLPNYVFCRLKIKCIFGSRVHQLKRRANSPDIEQQQNNLGPKCIFHSKWIIPILLNGKLWVGKHPGYCFPEQVNSSTPTYIIFCNSQKISVESVNLIEIGFSAVSI